jgi:hypothetical protein
MEVDQKAQEIVDHDRNPVVVDHQVHLEVALAVAVVHEHN